jgi:hypothetical protein
MKRRATALSMPVKARTRRSASSTFTQSHVAQTGDMAGVVTGVATGVVAGVAAGAMANVPADERLLLLKAIAELIGRAKRLDLSECAFLLGMAQIGLQAKIHNISDEEMAAFMDVVRESVDRE